MPSKGSVILAIIIGGVLAVALVALFKAPISVATFIGLAASGYTATMPWALRDGRFPGPRSSVRARRVTGAASALILGSALVGVVGLDVERTTRLSLQLLVLAVGSAAFNLGAAAALLDSSETSSESDSLGRLTSK